TRTLLAALLLATLAGILFSPRFESPVQAQAPSSKFKVSDDLQGIMARDPNVWVPVIIQTVSEPADSLMSEVGCLGGAGHRAYKHVKAVTVQLPARVVTTLASRLDVKHVSLDRHIQTTGHLETTTGAAMAQHYGTTATGTIAGS